MLRDVSYSEFYNGGRNKNNITLEDIWGFNFQELEHIHNWVQYAFPIIEPSYFNRESPKLTKQDVEDFNKDKEMQKKLFKSFYIFLNFLGLKYVLKDGEDVIEKGDNYEERSKKWQTSKNHNFLRITRIIHCLKVMGLPELAKAFYNCLKELVKENPRGFNETSVRYWDEAIKCEEKI